MYKHFDNIPLKVKRMLHVHNYAWQCKDLNFVFKSVATGILYEQAKHVIKFCSLTHTHKKIHDIFKPGYACRFLVK